MGLGFVAKFKKSRASFSVVKLYDEPGVRQGGSFAPAY